jgi:predicted transcriptional regulator
MPARTLNEIRQSFGLTWRILADEYRDGTDVRSRIVALSRLSAGQWRPRFDTVQAIQAAFNSALNKVGSQKSLTYDEINVAIEEGIRRYNEKFVPSPSLKPDLAAGLTALGDLGAVDQPAAAPSAQEI